MGCECRRTGNNTRRRHCRAARRFLACQLRHLTSGSSFAAVVICERTRVISRMNACIQPSDRPQRYALPSMQICVSKHRGLSWQVVLLEEPASSSCCKEMPPSGGLLRTTTNTARRPATDNQQHIDEPKPYVTNLFKEEFQCELAQVSNAGRFMPPYVFGDNEQILLIAQLVSAPL